MREMSLRGSSASAEGGCAAREPEGEAASTPGSEQAPLGGLSFATRGPTTGRQPAYPRPEENSETPLDPVTLSASSTTPKPTRPSQLEFPIRTSGRKTRPEAKPGFCFVLFLFCCFLYLSVRWHTQRSRQTGL